MRRLWLCSIVACLGLAGAAVAVGQTLMVRPNLYPDPGPQQPPYCRRSQGSLVVTVKSVGPVTTTPLAPFYVKVVFTPGGTAEKEVRALLPGSSTDVLFALPPACFNPECNFTITVDSRKNIRQADRSNNTASGRCPRA